MLVSYSDDRHDSHPRLFRGRMSIAQALQAEPDNVKALYRRAVVYRLRDEFE